MPGRGGRRAPDSWELWLDCGLSRCAIPTSLGCVRSSTTIGARPSPTSYERAGSGEFSGGPDEFAVAVSALLDGLAMQIAFEDPVDDPQRAFLSSMRSPPAQFGFTPPWRQERRVSSFSGRPNQAGTGVPKRRADRTVPMGTDIGRPRPAADPGRYWR